MKKANFLRVSALTLASLLILAACDQANDQSDQDMMEKDSAMMEDEKHKEDENHDEDDHMNDEDKMMEDEEMDSQEEEEDEMENVEESESDEMGDIVAVATEAGFDTLVTAVTTAELVETLQGEGPFTVFAPTNEAFEALPEGALDDLLADPVALADVLLYHVVSGQVMAEDVAPGMVETVGGQSFEITIEGDEVMVNDAKVTQTDVMASNGVIHVIDAVLLPASE